MMDARDAEEFTSGLEQIGEGWWRQVALGVKLGVPADLGLTRGEWCDRFKVTMRGEERLEAITELQAEGLSNRAIADVLGVDPQTVANDMRAENSAPEDATPEEDETEDAENSATTTRQTKGLSAPTVSR